MHPNFAGALINSALYLVFVFVVAIVSANRVAEIGAITATGVTFLSHVMQFTAEQTGNSALNRVACWLVIISWVLAVAAGILLFV